MNFFVVRLIYSNNIHFLHLYFIGYVDNEVSTRQMTEQYDLNHTKNEVRLIYYIYSTLYIV